jgi:heme/copper-type cytochrome/quinol oxidase subunit 2
MLSGCNVAEFNPEGAIGEQERTLIITALGVMLLVVIPVIVMTFCFAWRYRASNPNATYAPKWAHSTSIEVVVWTIPCLIRGIPGRPHLRQHPHAGSPQAPQVRGRSGAPSTGNGFLSIRTTAWLRSTG